MAQYNKEIMMVDDFDLLDSKKEEREKKDNVTYLPDPWADPVSDEKYGSSNNFFSEEAAREIKIAKQKANTKNQFSMFPDSFLIINDIVVDVPITSLKGYFKSDALVSETIRTKAPVISTKGTRKFILEIDLFFDIKKQAKLHRLLSQITAHPLIFVHNNDVKRKLNLNEIDTTIFIVDTYNIRSIRESPGAVSLTIKANYFNYKPFSNNFKFNTLLPGYSKRESLKTNNTNRLTIGDLRTYEASEFTLSRAADEVLKDIREEALSLDPAGKNNLPVNFPSESDAWMYFAEHLQNQLPPIDLKDTSDYIGFKVRRYVSRTPESQKARLGKGRISDFFGRHPKIKEKVPGFYDLTRGQQESIKVDVAAVEVLTSAPSEYMLKSSLPEDAPVVYMVDHGFASRGSWAYKGAHSGVDLFAFKGAPVRCPANGKVIHVGKPHKVFSKEDMDSFAQQRASSKHSQKRIAAGAGLNVQIYHPDLQNTTTWYMHLEQAFVKEGDHIKRGQVVGTVGSSTGKYYYDARGKLNEYGNSFSPHLHFEVLKSNVSVDGNVKTPASGKKNLHLRLNPYDFLEKLCNNRTKFYKNKHKRDKTAWHKPWLSVKSELGTGSLEYDTQGMSEEDIYKAEDLLVQEQVTKLDIDRLEEQRKGKDRVQDLRNLDNLGTDSSESFADETRSEWIRRIEDQEDLHYYRDDNTVPNVFYEIKTVNVSGDYSSHRSGTVLPKIVCSSLSIVGGNRIAPIKLVGQDYYTYQFLGAGNKMGKIILTFAGTEGKNSADRIKEIIKISQDNARNFSFIQDSGSIELLSFFPESSSTNNILRLFGIKNVVITDMQETSSEEGLDKHHLVLDFIAQDFQEESLDKRFSVSLESNIHIIKNTFELLKADKMEKIKEKYFIFPKPSIAYGNSSFSPNLEEGRSWVKKPGVASWLAKMAIELADDLQELDDNMPPVDMIVSEKNEKVTWRHMYALWGAAGLLNGRSENISAFERTSVNRSNPAGVFDPSLNLNPVENKTSSAKYKFSNASLSGKRQTQAKHAEFFLEFKKITQRIVRIVREHSSDKETLDKFYPGLFDQIYNNTKDDLGSCYEDMSLPDIPNTPIKLAPDFYVYNDFDEDPSVLSITDSRVLEKALSQHIMNQVASFINLYKDTALGGAYISENINDIVRKRTRNYGNFRAEEIYQGTDLVSLFYESSRTWEPVYHRYTDGEYDSGSGLSFLKKLTSSLSGSNSDQKEVRLDYMSKVISLSPYLDSGRKWMTDTPREHIVSKLYGEAWDKITFGPDPRYKKADLMMKGELDTLNKSEESTYIKAAKKVAKDNDSVVHLPNKVSVLPDGSVTLGETEVEKELSHPMFQFIGQLSNFAADLSQSNKLTIAGDVVSDYTKYLTGPFKFNDNLDLYKGIKILNEHLPNQPLRENPNEKLAESAAAIALGSKAHDFSLRRAYPTFKIYFIEEDAHDSYTEDGKVIRAFDDFYSYSAVQSIMINEAKDNPGHLAIIRMTNIGGKLLRKRFGKNDIEKQAEESSGILSDTDYENPFERLVLQDGIKVQIRIGYDSNPDNLTSKFLGQIVEIQTLENGKILEIVCQSYGAELSAVELGPLDNGELFFTPQQVLSAAMMQKFIANFGRQSKFNKFNIAEIRHAGSGNTDLNDTATIFAAGTDINHFSFRDVWESWKGMFNNLLGHYGDREIEKMLHQYTFLNDPRDDNIYTPPPYVYSTWWSRNLGACVFRPLKQTPWDIFKEHELRHPGFVAYPVPYGHEPRMTMFFGARGQFYWSRPPSQLEIQLSEGLFDEIIKLKGLSLEELLKSGIYSKLKTLATTYPQLAKEILNDIASKSVPVGAGYELGKITGRFVPFRNYHFLDDKHHIIANNIKTSVDGTFNEVEIVYNDDLSTLRGDSGKTAKTIRELEGEGDILTVKLDDRIKDEKIRSYREEFPSCITEDMAARYAQGLFMKNLRDCYKGEIVVLGDPTMKPYDVCNISDGTTGMTGPIEIGDVTHIFDRERGYICVIKPDMVLDTNDFLTASSLDIVCSAMSYVYGVDEATTMTLNALNPLGMLAAFGGVKLMRWTQEGSPVVITPLVLGGRPFTSTIVEPSRGVSLAFHGHFMQYIEDLHQALDRYSFAEDLLDKRLSMKKSMINFFGHSSSDKKLEEV